MKAFTITFFKSPATENEIRGVFEAKASLKLLYLEIYEEFKKCIERSVPGGLLLEIGSGVGFAKEVIPNLVTSDVLPYSTVDERIDATRLPFGQSSISTILMHNVFHHISDVKQFLTEAERCLLKGGRILISDQFPGLFAKHIYKYLHHETFNEKAEYWMFPSTHPLMDSNGALAWLVFVRDVHQFQGLCPKLRIERFEPHTPLRYWLCGGLKKWSLLPRIFFRFYTRLDRVLLRISPELGSFVFIELVKVKD